MNPAPLDLGTVLSPDWLEAVLGARFPGVRIAATAVVEELVTVASKVRFRVQYARNPGGAAPRALCVKGYFERAGTPMAAAGQAEARFYAQVAPHLGVRVPPCFHAAADPDTGHGLILMEDLVAAGSTFLTALSPYSVDQTAATLEQLARLHTAKHPLPEGSEGSWLAPRLAHLLGHMSEERLQTLLDDGRADSLAPQIRRADRLRAALGEIAAHSASRASCLVHGDAHAGNLYLDPGGAPGLIDWQLVQRGTWELDVAYHIGAVLDPSERRRQEQALLGHYLERVRALGGATPPPAEAWDAYRRALVYGYFLWAITQRVERPILETFVARLGAAVQDHDSFDRLGV